MEYLQSQAQKSLKLIKRNKLQFLLIFIGLTIFSFGAVNYYRIRILSFNNTPKEVETKNNEIPVQITIPSLNLELPIDQGEIKNGVWGISEKNATHLKTSANPRGGGNIVIYGHNKTAIFGKIPSLKIGEEINIKTSSGDIYKYKLTNKLWVKPDRIDLVSPTTNEELTLYTCGGLFDSLRVVLKASPVI